MLLTPSLSPALALFAFKRLNLIFVFAVCRKAARFAHFKLASCCFWWTFTRGSSDSSYIISSVVVGGGQFGAKIGVVIMAAWHKVSLSSLMKAVFCTTVCLHPHDRSHSLSHVCHVLFPDQSPHSVHLLAQFNQAMLRILIGLSLSQYRAIQKIK